MSRSFSVLLLLTLLVITECSIKLNLQRVSINPKKDGSPADEDVYVYAGKWGVQRQPLNTAIDISSSSTYIIDDKCENCLTSYPYKCQDKCQKQELYCSVDDSMINDGLYVQFSQGSTKQTCQVGTEVFRFGNYDLNQVSVSFPFKLSGYENFYKTIPASLGVGLKGSTNYRAVQTSFFDSLAASKFRIEQNLISFYFGKQKAVAIFGVPDSAFTQNKKQTVELYCPRENDKSPLKTAPNFASLIAGIKIAEKDEIPLKDLTLRQYYHAYFSTTSKFIQISDKDLLQNIKTQIQSKANLGACKQSDSLIDCEIRDESVFPDIRLNFQVSSDNIQNLQPVILKGEDYVERYQTTDGKKRVLVLFKVKDQLISADSVNRDQIIFGEPLFRSNFITFNHDNRRIYIQPAPAIPISDLGLAGDWRSNLLIGSGILIVLLGTLIILNLLEPLSIVPRVQQVPKTPKSKNEPVFQTIPPNVVQTKIVYTQSQPQLIYLPQQQASTVRIPQGSPQRVILQSVNGNIPVNR